MAIKFVDKGSEREPKRSSPMPAIKPDKGIPNESIEPELPPPGPQAGSMPHGQLPFAKTEPKPRGRKKPLK